MASRNENIERQIQRLSAEAADVERQIQQIDAEEDPHLRAVLVGMLREANR